MYQRTHGGCEPAVSRVSFRRHHLESWTTVITLLPTGAESVKWNKQLASKGRNNIRLCVCACVRARDNTASKTDWLQCDGGSSVRQRGARGLFRSATTLGTRSR